MPDLKLEATFREQVLRDLRSRAPPREIMTMLMSNGWTEVEAQEFVTRLSKDIPATEAAGPRRTDPSSGMPLVITGGAMLATGILLAGFFNPADVLFAQRGLIFGGVLLIGGGLTRIATGSD